MSVTVQRLIEAVRAGDSIRVRAMLALRPELVNFDVAENNEHRALHYAVMDRLPKMVRVLMEHGADARKGIYPHRDATGALTLATERGYDEIVTIIQEAEQRRRKSISSAPDELTDVMVKGDEARAIAMLESEPTLTGACNRNGWTMLHVAAALGNERITTWLLEHGADVNRQGPGAKTALDQAVGRGRREQFASLAQMLRQRGAMVTARAAVALGEADWLRACS